MFSSSGAASKFLSSTIAEDVVLKQGISPQDAFSVSPFLPTRCLRKSPKEPYGLKYHSFEQAREVDTEALRLDKAAAYTCDESMKQLSASISSLLSYEMLLWIGINKEDKIKELLDNVASKDGEDRFSLQENYLLALSESDRENDVLLLNSIDITKVSSANHIANIFRSLGRHSLESIAKEFLQELKVKDVEVEKLSNFIYNYANSIPNLTVGDIVLNINNLHAELEVAPSSVLYEKLVKLCCDSLKVHTALDIVDQILEAGFTLSVEVFLSILNSCDESYDYNLVRHIYALMCHHSFKPNSEIFRCMIGLSVKMKDYDGAYGMIRDLEKINRIPTAGMYNAILAGHFRDENFTGALNVLREMEKAEVPPDSQTFSYLISNLNFLFLSSHIRNQQKPFGF